MLRHGAGAVMAAAGAWLLWRAARCRREAAAAAGRGEAPPPLHPSLAGMAELGPPLIIVGLVAAAIEVVLAFLATGGGVFSAFDLAGFLALLAGYGVWAEAKVAHGIGPGRRRRGAGGPSADRSIAPEPLPTGTLGAYGAPECPPRRNAG